MIWWLKNKLERNSTMDHSMFVSPSNTRISVLFNAGMADSCKKRCKNHPAGELRDQYTTPISGNRDFQAPLAHASNAYQQSVGIKKMVVALFCCVPFGWHLKIPCFSSSLLRKTHYRAVQALTCASASFTWRDHRWGDKGTVGRTLHHGNDGHGYQYLLFLWDYTFDQWGFVSTYN